MPGQYNMKPKSEMNRRGFLKSLPATLLLPKPRLLQLHQIQTVQGLVSAEQLGTTLMHEHVMVDFIGADKASRERYDRDEVFRAALPFLKQARARGGEDSPVARDRLLTFGTAAAAPVTTISRDRFFARTSRSSPTWR